MLRCDIHVGPSSHPAKLNSLHQEVALQLHDKMNRHSGHYANIFFTVHFTYIKISMINTIFSCNFLIYSFHLDSNPGQGALGPGFLDILI